MFRLALAFYLLGLTFAFIGAYEVIGMTQSLGKLLLMIFLTMAVLSYIAGLFLKK